MKGVASGVGAGPAYGTRWMRALPLLVLALLAMGALAWLSRAQVLAASLTYQGGTAKFSTGRVEGQDVGFGMSRITVRDRAGASDCPTEGETCARTVLSAGFATGRLDGFCLSQRQSLPVLGSVTVKVTAGDSDPGTREISAVNVQFDLTSLRGNGSGLNLDGMVHIGLAAQDITTLPGVDNPLGAPTGTGHFGIDATRGDIFAAKGFLYDAEIGGPMSLPNLSITVVPGGPECWSSETSTTDLPH